MRCCVQTRSSEPSWAPHPLQAPDQYSEAGGVEEPDLVQVDDELVAALGDQVDEQLPQPRRRIHIDLALHVDDLDAVLGVVTQLQIHTSSSVLPGVISTSIPAPRAGVVRARADPLPHLATFHYRAHTECSGCQGRQHPGSAKIHAAAGASDDLGRAAGHPGAAETTQNPTLRGPVTCCPDAVAPACWCRQSDTFGVVVVTAARVAGGAS